MNGQARSIRRDAIAAVPYVVDGTVFWRVGNALMLMNAAQTSLFLGERFGGNLENER